MNDRFSDPKHIKWSKAVKERDDFICQICGKRGIYLNSHHIYSYDRFKKLRFNINNGISLCLFHHETFHKIYGAGNNTEFQLKEFIKLLKIIQEIVESD